MQDRPKLGQILVDAGIIDGMQLESALGEQSRWGRRLGVTLIKLGMVEEHHLIRALAKQLDLPVASLAGKRIPEEVLAHVPARIATQHSVIPLFVKEGGKKGQLFLGMEDPSDLQVLDDLCFRTGMEVYPVMVGPTELGDAIDRYYLQRDGGPFRDSVRSGETLGEGSLRAVTETGETVEMLMPVQTPAQQPAVMLEPLAADPGQPSRSQPLPPLQALPTPQVTEIELSEPTPVLPEGLLEDVARAVDESERTRLVTKAIAQLLIEKGILGLDEIQAKIAQLKGASQS